MEKMNVYADNAATTRLCDEAFSAMVPYLKENFYNPSGAYTGGVLVRGAINDARHAIAGTLGAYDKEIIFTSGGSEADALALKGVMHANKESGRHLITTKIEHHAVLEACRSLEKEGFRVSYAGVDENGLVDPQEIESLIREDTVLISVMAANNELGTLEPIKEIGLIAKKHNVLFHTDAVQLYGKEKLIPSELNIDLLSASAHKINGPKGTGFLYVRSGVKVAPVINGGSQEYRLRGGTENVAGIVGTAKAAELSFTKMAERKETEENLGNYFTKKVLSEIQGVKLNCSEDKKLPGIINLSFEGVEGSSLLILLDMKGVCASSGSACAQSLEEPSHVLLATGKTREETVSSLRFSINYENTQEEIDYLITVLKESVEYLRKMRA